jgi:putative transposase
MRYPASEKLEIIRTVEASHLPVRQTLAMLGIPSTTYYRWYDRWSEGGLDALDDTAPHPGLSGTASRMRPGPTLSSSPSSMKS